MKKKYTVVFVTPEMMIPELPEPACGANFRGGLGILAGDIMDGAARRGVKIIGITPLYQLHWMTREDTSSIISALPLKCETDVLGRRVQAREINRGGSTVLGIWAPEIYNFLYTPDRWQRLQQEVILGHAVSAILEKLNIKPDIIWLNEGHTAIAIPAVKENPFFAGTKKFLFTTHTPVPEGMEKFYGDWFGELKINSEKYYSVFVKDGMVDMTRAAMILSDQVNAVSQEHAEITKQMFPEFARKIIGITNGSSRKLWLSSHLKESGKIAKSQFLQAQQSAKKELIKFIEGKTGKKFDPEKPIFAWVRRIAWYKQQHPMLVQIIQAICAERGEIIETSLGKLEGLGMQVFSAGRAHESDSHCLGWMAEFENWQHQIYNFVFLSQYAFELLKIAADGCDVWFSCPLPAWEACGTSDRRATINGRVNLATRAGGAKEYIKEYNPVTGEGNGFFLEPYEPITVYRKLRIISDLYYSWKEKGDNRWPKLTQAAFEAGKSLDVTQMIEQYEKVFEKLSA